MLRVQSLLPAGIFLLASASQGLADVPSFTPLGTESWATDVSADGTTVVGNMNAQGFRWRNGVMSGLGFPNAPAEHVSANGVSADGGIIAGSISGPGTNEPYHWQNGEFTLLGRIPGYGDNMHLTVGISNDGSRIAGWGTSAGGFQSQAWYWDNGTMIGLGTHTGNGSSTASGISGDGNVVVGESNGAAFRWSDGAMTILNSVPPPFSGPNLMVTSNAFASSYDGGSIVGMTSAFDYDTEQLWSQALLWTDEGVTGLGTLAGGSLSSASAISDDGRVVGGASDSSEGTQAFIWTKKSGMRSLKDILVNDLGMSLNGWSLASITGLSENGRVVVGNGFNPAGQPEAFRAVIPEPATFSLLVAAGMILTTRRESPTKPHRKGRGFPINGHRL